MNVSKNGGFSSRPPGHVILPLISTSFLIYYVVIHRYDVLNVTLCSVCFL